MNRVGNFSVLSPIVQIGNIASEVTRARVWQDEGNDLQLRESLARALELVGLFVSGDVERGLRREMARLKEVLAQFYAGEDTFSVTLLDLEEYLLQLFLLMRRPAEV